MRINFKKVSSVLASALMLGSTIGLAMAASYPAPFAAGGQANAVIVTGSNQNANDLAAATSIGNQLSKALTGQATTGAGTTATSGGDSYKIELASTKLNMDEALTDVITGTIQASDMPNLLTDGSLVGKKDSVEYKYTQEIILNKTLNYTAFKDNDYNDNAASIGIKIAKNDPVAIYKLSWNKQPKTATTSAARLSNLENVKIKIMGKEYTILNAYANSTATTGMKLDLMGGAYAGQLNIGETQTVDLAGHKYAIRIAFIDSTKVKLCIGIDGGAEEKCDIDLETGSTTQLSDGTQLGVRSINYQGYSGGIQSVDYSLGAKKLTLEDGQTAELNGEDVNGLEVTMATAGSGDTTYPTQIGDITLTWKAKEKGWVTADSSVTLPALETFKIQAGAFYTPKEEKIEVLTDGSYGIELKIPIKDGTATIPLLYGNGTAFTVIGADTDELLVTSNTTGNVTIGSIPAQQYPAYANGILWNETRDDSYFVVSWNATSDYVSYFCSADVYESSGVNYTKIKNEVTGETMCDTKGGSQCKFGNVVITMGSGNADQGTNGLQGGTGVSFNRVISKEGITFYLPSYNSSSLMLGAFGSVHDNGTTDGTQRDTDLTWVLRGEEEDKDGNLGKGPVYVNFTFGWRSSKAEVTDIGGNWAGLGNTLKTNAQLHETGKNTDIYEGWIASTLATKVLFNKPSSGQYTAELYYHGGESYANVFVTAPETKITVSTEGGAVSIATIKDTEITDANKAKNLIVVGGSCINSVAAKLLGSDTALCGSAWTTKTGIGAGKYLIQTFSSPYAGTQVAMLVAGYEAADTTNAASYLTTTTSAIDVTAGKKYVGATATSAELQTTV